MKRPDFSCANPKPREDLPAGRCARRATIGLSSRDGSGSRFWATACSSSTPSTRTRSPRAQSQPSPTRWSQLWPALPPRCGALCGGARGREGRLSNDVRDRDRTRFESTDDHCKGPSAMCDDEERKEPVLCPVGRVSRGDQRFAARVIRDRAQAQRQDRKVSRRPQASSGALRPRPIANRQGVGLGESPLRYSPLRPLGAFGSSATSSGRRTHSANTRPIECSRLTTIGSSSTTRRRLANLLFIQGEPALETMG